MTKEYKVLTRTDDAFGGYSYAAINAVALESALNKLAKQGWRVVGTTTGPVRSGPSSDTSDEVIVIMERDVPEPTPPA